MTIEQEAAGLLATALRTSPEDPRTVLLGARYGLNGQPPATLEHVGRSLGITRERVRQIQLEVTARLGPGPVHAPVLDRALTRVAVVDGSGVSADLPTLDP